MKSLNELYIYSAQATSYVPVAKTDALKQRSAQEGFFFQLDIIGSRSFRIHC